jgi:hypothetical protein
LARYFTNGPANRVSGMFFPFYRRINSALDRGIDAPL